MLAPLRRRWTALVSGAVVAAGLAWWPVNPASGAAPVVCSATGGTQTTATINNIRYVIHTFTATENFVPAQNTKVDYLVVGGGGGGGGSRGDLAATGTGRGVGGGGGSGAVVSGSTDISSTQSVTVGAGGIAGTRTTTGGTGGVSSIGALVSAAGGGGGGSPGVGPGGNGASGGGGSGDSVAQAGGTATAGSAGGAGQSGATVGARAGGGGGGPGGAGSAASGTAGGAGGGGTSSSITGSSVTYGGGGGGGGSPVGAAGGAGAAGASDGNGTAATANRGGGGGGSRSTSTTQRSGGAGGSGVVIIRYPRYCLNPSQPTSVSFSSPTMSWGAPTFVPAGQSVSSYTVTVQQSGDTTSGIIYARGSSATSVNITGTTQAACAANNPGWTCGDAFVLVSGQTYQFSVFARTASSLGQAFPNPNLGQSYVQYTVP